MHLFFRPFAPLACFFACLLLFSAAQAQSWKRISSDHFDVYFLTGEEEAALKVGHLAEAAREELAKTYDMKPMDRGRILYRSNALASARPQLDNILAQGMSLPLTDAVVVHPGSREGLVIAVREAVSRMLLLEISYSRGGPAMLYERMTYYMPTWYEQALVEYMATGWRYEDDILLQSLDKSALSGLARYDTTLAGDIARKSIWHFVATDYGFHKLPEIAYLASISGSVESGLLAVLGLSMPRFSATWLEFISQYADNIGLLRTSLGQIDGLEEVKLPWGWAPVATKYHKATRQVALVAQNAEATAVFCYKIEDGVLVRTGIGGAIPAYRPGYGSTYAPGLPLAWNPQGNTLVSATFLPDGTQQLVVAEVSATHVRTIPLPQGYDRVLHLSWAPDGKRLAGTVLRNGQTDLFVCSAAGTGFRLLTNDEADEAWPVWNGDSDRLFFCSNREADGKMGTKGMDIWAGTVDDKVFAPEALLVTPNASETHLSLLSAVELTYLSNATGVPNLAAYHLVQQSERWLTNLGCGMTEAVCDEKLVVFSFPLKGKCLTMIAPLPQLALDQAPLLSPYRVATNLKGKAKPPLPPTMTSLPATPAPAPGVARPARKDSAASSAAPSRQAARYYVFDEDDAPYVAAPASSTQPSATAAPERPAAPPGAPMAAPLAAVPVSFSAPQRVSHAWEVTNVLMGTAYNPAVRRPGLDLRMQATDMLHGHTFSMQVRPYLSLQLRSWDANAGLYIRRNAWVHGFRATGFGQHYVYLPTSNSAETEVESFRYLQGAVRYSLTRPVAPALTAGGEAAVYYQTKTPTVPANPQLRREKGGSVSVYGTARYNRVMMRNGHPMRGTVADLRLGAMLTPGGASALAFGEIHLVARNYLRVGGAVLATRATVALSALGQGRTYNLGGSEGQMMLLEGLNVQNQVPTRLDTSLYGYSFQEFMPVIHGSTYAARRGSRLLALNAELRLPLLAPPATQLDGAFPARVELIPFFDVGTAWSTGNPFSQTNPTDSKLINLSPVTIELQTLNSPFVFSGGAGLRMQVYGISLRTDMAWVMENETLSKARLSLSIGRDF